MATHVFPVLLWRDASGGVTGLLVGDYRNASACGATPQEVLRQLSEALAWRAEHESWSIDPELLEPQLREVKVEVRAQYKDETGHRLIPSPETVTLRVPCVTGKAENGLPVCEVPVLELRFHFHNEAQLKELVRHYVKDHLTGMTPADLALKLPPRNAWLEQVSVREVAGSTRQTPMREREDMQVLFTVADPLLHDRGPSSAAYGRDAQVMTVLRKLTTERVHVLLVGEPGCGKSTIITDAARRMARLTADDESDNSMRTWRCWRGSGARMIAGMKYLGQWEERCEEFIQKLSEIEGVFCAENLLELLRVGGAEANDSVGAFLLPFLQRRELHMIAEASPAEVDACRRLMPGLLDVFQIVHVPAFGDNEARNVLERVAHACATSGRLEFAPGSVTLVHRLFRRFQPCAAFPGPASAFIRKLAERAGRQTLDSRRVDADDVLALFVQQTGLPELLLRDEWPLPFDEVRESLAAQIIGQPAAVEAAARVITGIKAGMTDPGRPQGVMLFCGPTGVGKTALARAMSEFCFGSGTEKERLVRLDMSEYGSWGAAHRLLHAPDGDAAAWIQKLRRQPFSVLLFDEIEKAAAEVYDALLGLLDEGRLTDRFGRVTDFRSAIIVMTSNLGATSRGAMGFGADQVPPAFETAVKKFFRPEFFNRLDAVVTFDSLAQTHVRDIALKELHDLNQREGLAASGLTLSWSEELLATLVRDGYDHRFGARPLQRALERLVVTPLAKWRLENAAQRDATLSISLEDGGTRIQAA
ncbi:MAG: ATP-dependent Clp protease ATP-binding subunit [Prosthecobacter sp.]|jgi:ATP-dependent Clp protease ATP-binding subunit ClpC|uniref:AAA family ATPase n=1 Tax=Prosthecobacter sp. TaxID=1965333 RepID=UPI0019E89E5F|nr:AAA family ATPase [Prosthecobacter sp.]MBE2284155.1 ATP-dependent Clp protease ATP-binding subunit [Prosthecobacter sp.]